MSQIFSFEHWSHSLVTTMLSSPNPIFKTGSTDFGMKFEMGELEKNDTGECKFKGGARHFSWPQEFRLS